MKSLAYSLYYDLDIKDYNLKECVMLAKKLILNPIGTKAQLIKRIKTKLEEVKVLRKHLALIILNETIKEIYDTSKSVEEFYTRLNNIDENILKDSYSEVWSYEYNKEKALNIALKRLYPLEELKLNNEIK